MVMVVVFAEMGLLLDCEYKAAINKDKIDKFFKLSRHRQMSVTY